MMAAPRPSDLPMVRSLVAFCLAVAVVGASAPASAQPVAAADARAARSVVAAQLDAFANDDAQRAFSYAAPAIRTMFGTPERFLAMVRAGYPVVYRAAGATFLVPVKRRRRDRPGRPSHRRRRRAVARHLPPRAPGRRRLADQGLRRAAGRRQDGLRRAPSHELSRRRHRQHAPQVGALREGRAGRAR